MWPYIFATSIFANLEEISEDELRLLKLMLMRTQKQLRSLNYVYSNFTFQKDGEVVAK